jgi:hypothetical protein
MDGSREKTSRKTTMMFFTICSISIKEIYNQIIHFLLLSIFHSGKISKKIDLKLFLLQFNFYPLFFEQFFTNFLFILQFPSNFLPQVMIFLFWDNLKLCYISKLKVKGNYTSYKR